MKWTNKKGLTLIELVIVAALLAVVAGLMYGLFGQGLVLYTMNTASAQEQQNMRQVLSEITNRFRLADADSISCIDNVLSIGSDVYKLQSDQILRNDAVIARGMALFEASISAQLLHITIRNEKGAELSTSLSLAG